MPLDTSRFPQLDAAALVKHRKHEWDMVKEDQAKTGSLMVVYQTIGGCELQIEFENGDQHKATLQAAAVAAVTRVTNLRIRLPKLRFVITPATGVRNIAFLGDRNGDRAVTIFLGPKVMAYEPKASPANENIVTGGMGRTNVRGVPDQIYDKNTFGKDQARAEAIVVHELGHMLHELHSEQIFWNLKLGFGDPTKPLEYRPPPTAPGTVTPKISQYCMAQQNYLELVAECFCGRVFGLTYDKAVLAEYTSAGGYWP